MTRVMILAACLAAVTFIALACDEGAIKPFASPTFGPTLALPTTTGQLPPQAQAFVDALESEDPLALQPFVETGFVTESCIGHGLPISIQTLHNAELAVITEQDAARGEYVFTLSYQTPMEVWVVDGRITQIKLKC